MPFLAYTYTAGGPMTRMNFYEIAAGMITTVVSGGNIEFGGVGVAKNIDHLTPMQPRFASEVAHAAVGMTRAEAGQIVEQLVGKYEHRLDDPPKGVSFQEAYDWGTIEPKPEYVELYAEMKEELAELGLHFK
jgi:methylamine--corrinoid protein Co-methyltransferase